MSLFIFENNEFIKFSDFLLSESIKPKETLFGTNKEFNNLKILNYNGVKLSSFKTVDKVFTVIIDKDNEIGFHYTLINNIDFENFNYIDAISENDSFLTLGTSNAAKTFGFVFYIVLQIAKEYNLPELIFSAEHDKLENIYVKMVNNKYFIEEFKSNSYRFEKQNNKYIFKRI